MGLSTEEIKADIVETVIFNIDMGLNEYNTKTEITAKMEALEGVPVYECDFLTNLFEEHGLDWEQAPNDTLLYEIEEIATTYFSKELKDKLRYI
jgi:hypothetical protein